MERHDGRMSERARIGLVLPYPILTMGDGNVGMHDVQGISTASLALNLDTIGAAMFVRQRLD